MLRETQDGTQILIILKEVSPTYSHLDKTQDPKLSQVQRKSLQTFSNSCLQTIQLSISYIKLTHMSGSKLRNIQNKISQPGHTLPEMRAFLGLTFLMRITVKPDIRSYWSTDIALDTPFFSKTMSRDRFHQIMRYLHFNNPNQHVPQAGEPNRDCLYKVRTIMNIFNEQMKSQYVPKR